MINFQGGDRTILVDVRALEEFSEASAESGLVFRGHQRAFPRLAISCAARQ